MERGRLVCSVPSFLLSLCVSLATAAAVGGAEIAPVGPVRALSERWRWRHFDVGADPSLSRVTALFQDTDEFVYAAAASGVHRYDLYEWVRLDAPVGFPERDVRRILQSLDVVVVATARALWSVERGIGLRPIVPADGSLVGDVLIAAGTERDAYVIDAGRRAQFRLRGRALEPSEAGVRMPAGRILDYEIDGEGRHWLVTSLGLHTLDAGGRRWVEQDARDFALPFADPECVRLIAVGRPDAALPAPGSVEPLGRGRRPLLGVFRPRGEADRWLVARRESGRWEPVKPELAGSEGTSADDVLLDRSGSAYATCEDGRLFALSRSGASWVRVSDPAVGEVKQLHAAFVDGLGAVWFRRGLGGLAVCNVASRRWESLRSLPDVPYPRVLSLVETSGGDLWVGTSIGVLRYRRGFSVAGAEEAAPELFDRVREARLRDITGLAEDARGRVWISSAEAFPGALYFRGNTWVEEKDSDFSDRPVRRIVRDRRDELWFLPDRPASAAGAPPLYRRSDLTADQILAVDVVGLPEGKSVNDITATRGAHGDRWWLATAAGLLECRLDSGRLVVETRLSSAGGLASDEVWSVCEGPDGALWICYPSSGHGVTRIQGGSVRTFTSEDGLAHPKVWSLLSVGGDLWCGTEGGLTRFDGECWYRFPVASADRESSWVFPLAAAADVSGQGYLWVGTLAHGVLRYRAADQGRPRVTRIDAPRQVREGRPADCRWQARDYRDDTRPQDLVYRVRLDGGSWSAFQSQAAMTLHGLAPGIHSLVIEARDVDGNRNRDEARVTFEVTGGGQIPVLGVIAASILVCILLAAVRLRSMWKAQRSRVACYAALFHGFPGAVLVVGRDGRVRAWNGGLAALLGLAAVDEALVVGRTLDALSGIAAGELAAMVEDSRRRKRRPVLATLLAGDARAHRIRVTVTDFALDAAVVLIEELTEGFEDAGAGGVEAGEYTRGPAERRGDGTSADVASSAMDSDPSSRRTQ